ncbi:hypothetical protein FHW77_002865 [Agrobacterium sp. RC10-4-1]|uniref:hypothetical protein n=1 Tax=Agrobacterium sp. RC10-4-1 TaxID=2587039 RepID=UPI0015FA2B16|nr:hypothetical protein [Agrobacterium sp. RC10-4-1]MBA8799146.1 hypothetical protein [Agrobacterium sp. RC10-4-1]
MSNFTDIVDKEVLAELEKPKVRSKGFIQSQLARAIWDQIDDDQKFQVGHPQLIRAINRSAKKHMKSALAKYETAEYQLPFNIDGAISIPDGETQTIRITETLSQDDWDRAFDERRKQHEAYGNALEEYANANRMLKPIWQKHPKWTVGQCIRQIVKDASKRGR